MLHHEPGPEEGFTPGDTLTFSGIDGEIYEANMVEVEQAVCLVLRVHRPADGPHHAVLDIPKDALPNLERGHFVSVLLERTAEEE